MLKALKLPWKEGIVSMPMQFSLSQRELLRIFCIDESLDFRKNEIFNEIYTKSSKQNFLYDISILSRSKEFEVPTSQFWLNSACIVLLLVWIWGIHGMQY